MITQRPRTPSAPSVRTQVLLWTAQRASAAVLAICVLVHLVTIIYAVRGGLTAAEILARTQGNLAWAVFYGIFVVSVAIHAPLGLRTILAETFGWGGRLLHTGTAIFSAVLLVWGGLAVYAVIAP